VTALTESRRTPPVPTKPKNLAEAPLPNEEPGSWEISTHLSNTFECVVWRRSRGQAKVLVLLPPVWSFRMKATPSWLERARTESCRMIGEQGAGLDSLQRQRSETGASMLSTTPDDCPSPAKSFDLGIIAALQFHAR